MKPLRALIVEDEPQAQQIMKNLLAAHFPDIEVIGVTGSVKGTLDFLAGTTPDVIFLDVELSDGNCFQLFERADIRSHVIMTTAYDTHAVKAFEVNSLDYLLKPIDPAALQRAVARAVAAQEDALPPAAPPQAPYKGKFLIRLNDRIVPVGTRSIAYFYSEAKTSYIVTVEGTSYVLDESLDSLDGVLDPRQFFRISRSCIIAEDAIESISKLLGGRLRIALAKGITAYTDLTVSRARADAFLAWIEK